MKPMLASPLHEGIIKQYLETQGPLLLSPKLDGIRGIVRNGVVYGRSNKPLPNKYIQHMLSGSLYNHLDGELIVGSPNEGDVYKRAYSGVMTKIGEPNFTFFVFDYLENGELPYIDRYKKLAMFDITSLSFIRPLPQKMVSSFAQVLDFEQWCLENGYEGCMARRPNVPHREGKVQQKNPTEQSLLLMKVKREEDVDVQIHSCYEALENKNEAFINELGRTERSTHQENRVGMDTLGGFYVIYQGEPTKCAPGKFSHKERKEIWERWKSDPESLKKEFIKMRHFGYGADKKPRFPRALDFRGVEDMDTQ